MHAGTHQSSSIMTYLDSTNAAHSIDIPFELRLKWCRGGYRVMRDVSPTRNPEYNNFLPVKILFDVYAIG